MSARHVRPRLNCFSAESRWCLRAVWDRALTVFGQAAVHSEHKANARQTTVERAIGVDLQFNDRRLPIQTSMKSHALTLCASSVANVLIEMWSNFVMEINVADESGSEPFTTHERVTLCDKHTPKSRCTAGAAIVEENLPETSLMSDNSTTVDQIYFFLSSFTRYS